MAKKGHGGRGGAGGPPTRGRGGGRGRGRGRGGGGSAGFQPFQGPGHFVGGAPGSASPRGGTTNGRPYRGRGRGGHLSVQGQNRVGFDYSALARGPRGPRDDYGQDDDEQDENEDEDDAADFSIEPRAGYKHRIKPHLENDVHSDLEVDAPRSQQAHPSRASPRAPTRLPTFRSFTPAEVSREAQSSVQQRRPRTRDISQVFLACADRREESATHPASVIPLIRDRARSGFPSLLSRPLVNMATSSKAAFHPTIPMMRRTTQKRSLLS